MPTGFAFARTSSTTATERSESVIWLARSERPKRMRWPGHYAWQSPTARPPRPRCAFSDEKGFHWSMPRPTRPWPACATTGYFRQGGAHRFPCLQSAPEPTRCGRRCLCHGSHRHRSAGEIGLPEAAGSQLPGEAAVHRNSLRRGAATRRSAAAHLIQQGSAAAWCACPSALPCTS